MSEAAKRYDISNISKKIDAKFDDVLDVLQTFMRQVDERFNAVDKRFEKVDRELNDIRGAIAELSAQVRDYHQEMVFLNHHVDKLTEAVKQIARETGVKLTVEL